MFTGIIEHLGTVTRISDLSGGLELEIEAPFAADTHIDESIAVNGVCQTVTEQNSRTFTIQAVEETLRKTNFGALRQGEVVNLERSLTLDQRIEGHIVQGHVDTTGTIKSIIHEGVNWLVAIEYPEAFVNHIVGRGSIAIDGISLTVARDEGNLLTVAIIPYTWNHTNLKDRKEGDAVNLEFDILGKYILKYLGNLNRAENQPKLTPERLSELGY